MQNNYVIGVDFGTDSARAIIVNTKTGAELASKVSLYKRWAKKMYCAPGKNQFRQHPLDYIEALEEAIKGCVEQVGSEVRKGIKGISIATTGSTPVAVDKKGTPLALLPDFKENPNAMFMLWKDHSSIAEANEINEVAEKFQQDYLKYVGGAYSSEWYWAKLLHILRTDSQVKEAIYSFVEQSDWLPFLLTGSNEIKNLKRNVCAAGHKALWADEYEGLPPLSFFEAIDPILKKYASRFGDTVYSADHVAGTLCESWAQKLNLPTNLKIGVGSVDAHVGAVGGEIEPYYLSKVIGTSTCDMMVVPKPDMKDKVIKGISGQVNGSIVPNMVGLEAGQSAFGDIYAWFKNILLWSCPTEIKESRSGKGSDNRALQKLERGVLNRLNKEAAKLPLEEDAELAIDWFNGRRTPHVNHNLKGLITNLNLGSTPPRIFRALVEATCFGSRAIAESIEQQGITIKGVIAIGGIAKKSEYVIQTLADTLNRPIHIMATEKSVPLGAAMFASVICHLNPSLETAVKNMGAGRRTKVEPRKEYVEFYNKRYKLYKQYGAFHESIR